MKSIHQRLSDPGQRKVLQAAVFASWLLIAAVALWNRSATAAVLLGVTSGVLGLLAVKLALVDASAVSASAKSANARHRHTRTEFERIDETIGELKLELRDLRAFDGVSVLRGEVEMLTRLVEPYAALVEVQQQEILALREQNDGQPATTRPPIPKGPGPLFLHYHLPKTGGQTIRHILEEALDLGSTMLHLGLAAKQRGIFPSTNAGIAELSDTERDRVQVITGHQVSPDTSALFAGRQLWEFTMLRDPAARMVSHFNFERAMAHRREQAILDFDQWYATRSPNEMSRFLGEHLGVEKTALIDRISQLQFLGNTADMDQWLPLLLTVMGLPGVTPKRSNVTGVDHQRVLQLDDALRERIEADHPEDVELFRIASTEFFEPSLERLQRAAEATPRTK